MGIIYRAITNRFWFCIWSGRVDDLLLLLQRIIYCNGSNPIDSGCSFYAVVKENKQLGIVFYIWGNKKYIMRIMRISLLILSILFLQESKAQYEFKIITTVESIIPSGTGRSRLISTDENRNYKDFTSVRTDGKTVKDKRNKSDRGDIRVKNFEETKLLNFYNIAGIRFQNIAANDAVINSKINTMTEEGWELAFVSSAVESELVASIVSLGLRQLSHILLQLSSSKFSPK